MITIQDLQSAIAKVLTNNGNTVTANDIDDGFQKPTFFIDLFTNSTEVQNQYSELVNVGVELKYIPSIETREECIIKSGQIKDIFFSSPLSVSDRFLTVNDITFELEFLQERNIPVKEYEEIRNIEIGGVDNYGSSASNN